MSTFHVCIGDLEITGRSTQSLDKHDDIPQHCTITFFDTPTEQSQTIHAGSEIDMLNLLIDWFRCDDDASAHARLVALGIKAPFLP